MILNSNSSKSIWIYDESHCILDCLSPRSTLFPPNPLVEILRIWGQHKSVRLPDFGPWFHQSTGDFVGIKPTDLLTLQAFLKGDTGWKTDGFSSLKVASQKAPPEKKCQNTQNMAFYDMCDIKSIYICNICTFIYIYIILYISYVADILYSTNIIYFVHVIF